MAKMGRPVITIDWDQFEKLCQVHCTLEEIAGIFSCSSDTIERRVVEKYGRIFAEVFKEKSALGKLSLRRKQFELAQKGDKTMLVWLGKQFLGQVDNIEHRIQREEDAVLELSYDQLMERARKALPDLIAAYQKLPAPQDTEQEPDED